MASNQTTRRVTVMMMNSHQHIELVEVRVPVIMGGDVENVEFRCITEDAETAARKLLVDARADADDFSVVGVLVSVLHGLTPGRIVWAKEAEMVVTKTRMV